MKKFEFRLQRVLEYREAMEHWAQEAYLVTRVARLEGEGALAAVLDSRTQILKQPSATLDERKMLELRLQVLDDDERAKLTVIEVLQAEEERALELWHEKRRDLETMVKLRDKAKEEWELEAARREQSELDEWSVLKRGA